MPRAARCIFCLPGTRGLHSSRRKSIPLTRPGPRRASLAPLSAGLARVLDSPASFFDRMKPGGSGGSTSRAAATSLFRFPPGDEREWGEIAAAHLLLSCSYPRAAVPSFLKGSAGGHLATARIITKVGEGRAGASGSPGVCRPRVFSINNALGGTGWGVS